MLNSYRRGCVNRNALGILLLIQCVSSAMGTEDGLYKMAPDGAPGERIAFTLRSCNIGSNNNANDVLGLTAFIRVEPELADKYAVVVLAGKPFKVAPHAQRDKGTYVFPLIISDTELAAATKLFGKEPILRKHPGHMIDSAFKPLKESYAPGEKLMVKMTVRNLGTQPLNFRSDLFFFEARNDQFSFACTNSNEESIPCRPRHTLRGAKPEPPRTAEEMRKHPTIVTLEPGKSFSVEEDLSEWFTLTQPGEYRLRGSYFLQIHDGPTSHRIIWEDGLQRYFKIVIGKNEAVKPPTDQF